jgi:hypothetical protein
MGKIRKPKHGRESMKKLLLGIIILLFGVGLGSAFAADNMPSSKAAAAINALITLRADASDEGITDITVGWANILETQIKTPNQKELAFGVALQCGLITDTTVRSKGGNKDGSEAEGSIRVRVQVEAPDGSIRYALPSEENNSDLGVTYCKRFQKLEASFAGLNCFAAPYPVLGYCDGYVQGVCDIGGTYECTVGSNDGGGCVEHSDCDEQGTCTSGDVGTDCTANTDCDIAGGIEGTCEANVCTAGKIGESCSIADDCDLAAGAVYCLDPEELRLVLDTLNANAFNFILPNVVPGVQTIRVQAKANANVALSGTQLGSSNASAFVGLGSMLVESVRMIKGAEDGFVLELQD